MYAVVTYNDYRKEQYFKILHILNDLEEAKKLAYYYAYESEKKYLKSKEEDITNKDFMKILENYENEEIYLYPKNEIMVTYSIASCERLSKEKYIEYMKYKYNIDDDNDNDEYFLKKTTDEYILNNPIYKMNTIYSNKYSVLKIGNDSKIPFENIDKIFGKYTISENCILNDY